MEPSRETLDEPSLEPSFEPFSVIARIERHALPAFVWWAGGGLVLSFATFVVHETIFIVALWGVIGLAIASVILLIAAYRVYSEVVQLYADAQEMLREIAQLPQSLIASTSRHYAIAPEMQQLQSQPVASSTQTYDRDGIAIQFSEIFKEIS